MMKFILSFSLLISSLSVPLFALENSTSTHKEQPATMEFLLHSKENFNASLLSYRNGDERVVTLIQALKTLVDQEIMPASIPSVMDKPMTPLSGDKHDYMSMSPYWWPNPKTEDGMPFIRIDGKKNPLRDKLDNNNMSRMATSSWLLSVLYAFTGEEKYAEKAAEFLTVWFLNPETKMNPNMFYSQTIPGRSKLRRSGVLDSQRLIRIIDAPALLKGSPHWPEEKQKALKNWFKDFSEWLQTSKQGSSEMKAENNHGSYAEAQLAIFSAFSNNSSLAKEILENRIKERINHQFTAEGEQPEELKRTRPFHYCLFNLDAHVWMARLGEHIGVDLWNYKGKEGQSLERSIEFLANIGKNPSAWEYGNKIKKEDLGTLRYMLNQGNRHFDHPEWKELEPQLPLPKANIWGMRLHLEMGIF